VIQSNQPADPVIHFEAIRVARACRNVIQACLREEEWGLADEEFYKLIRESFERLQCDGRKP
jgi:hypothetical protein